MHLVSDRGSDVERTLASTEGALAWPDDTISMYDDTLLPDDPEDICRGFPPEVCHVLHAALVMAPVDVMHTLRPWWGG